MQQRPPVGPPTGPPAGRPTALYPGTPTGPPTRAPVGTPIRQSPQPAQIRQPGQPIGRPVQPIQAAPSAQPVQPVQAAPSAQPDSVPHEIEETEENHHIASEGEEDHPTTVSEFTVGAEETQPETTEPASMQTPEPLIHLSQPARYRHPDMKSFDESDLADLEDFKYHGYIPVDHSVFTSDFTFDGEIQVQEDVGELGTVTKYYIDEVEEVVEDVPVKPEPAPVAQEQEFETEPLDFPFDKQGVFHPSQPNPERPIIDLEEAQESIVRSRLNQPRTSPVHIAGNTEGGIQHIFHTPVIEEFILPTVEYVRIDETIVEPFTFFPNHEVDIVEEIIVLPTLARSQPIHQAPAYVHPQHIIPAQPALRLASPHIQGGYHARPERIIAPVHIHTGPVATRLVNHGRRL